MRSTRTGKKRNKKVYIRNILVVFLILIPAAAIISSIALNFAISNEKNINTAAVFTPKTQELEAFRYNFDIKPKQLYRVELKRFEKYEDAEALVETLKKKKLNGFIVKEQGYLAAYGLFCNKSQADTAAKYLNRKKIENTVNNVNINGLNIKYDDIDKNLVDLISAVDLIVIDIISEKSALSLESLYSDKIITGSSLDKLVQQEARLIKYLNYLEDIKTSKANEELKNSLIALINEVLVDKLQIEGSYDYYNLQNSLMNQGEALRKFYERLIVKY